MPLVTSGVANQYQRSVAKPRRLNRRGCIGFAANSVSTSQKNADRTNSATNKLPIRFISITPARGPTGARYARTVALRSGPSRNGLGLPQPRCSQRRARSRVDTAALRSNNRGMSSRGIDATAKEIAQEKAQALALTGRSLERALHA